MTTQTLSGPFQNLPCGHADGEVPASGPAKVAKPAAAAPSLRTVLASSRVRAWVPPQLIASLPKQ